ncbi:MAG: 3-dehydroquinate synthase [Candidatus Atribacteria bacterium]|nr:3-dehydroquinate synthase [Candidatus Atribacteria bacterium]
MQKLFVSGEGNRSYPVLVDKALFTSSKWLEKDRFPSLRGTIVTNSKVKPLYGQRLLSFFTDLGFSLDMITIPDGEIHKNLATVEEIYHQLIKLNLDRKSFLLSLGGGVITDITGFVASTFLRGIAYFQVPTSLLAQVDSSIGGKTGVNLPEGKNLVGTFYQPGMVLVDVSFLKTLPEREFREGLAEVAKTAFLVGNEFLDFLTKVGENIEKDQLNIMEEVVFRSLLFKKEIVEKDEKETGLRKILNYGHTIGHALEQSLGYGVLRHGEAVAVGMVGEAIIAREMGLAPPDLCSSQISLLRALKLPTQLEAKINWVKFKSALFQDKKKEGGEVKFSLLKDFGYPLLEVKVKEEVIVFALSQICEGVE